MNGRHVRRLLVTLAAFHVAAIQVHAQQDLVQSGPMVGRAEMREVELWVQTRTPATVRFLYWETANPSRRYATHVVRTEVESAGVAHAIADSVEPGRVYAYEVEVNGMTVARPWPQEFRTPPLWQWRSDPPTFTVATGSCAYINEDGYDRPGEPYGGEYQIFTSIAHVKPQIMLWLGDNTYLREADWNSRTGYLRRYTHTRSLPELGPLLAASSNYAIWDDHDYGPNNSDRGWREKETSLEVFRLFWCNPTYGTREMPGVSTSFEWGDVEFILLDNRWNRSPNERTNGERGIFGDRQIEWLIDRLSTSNATFKIVAVGGQLLNPYARFENYSTYADERKKLLDAISEANVSGVFFLSGDRHFTELTKLARHGDYPLYDLTVSPLTSQAYNNPSEPNSLRVEGTHLGRRNFVTLTFSGSLNERSMLIRAYDSDGRVQWERSIPARELKRSE